MRVLVAGATGVIGGQLLPALVAAGHDVTGLARNAPGDDADLAGVRIVVGDALNRASMERAVDEAAPDAVVNMLTAIPPEIDPKRLAEQFALTNRLRTEGTRNLLAAASGVKRVIAQGLAYAYDPRGDGPASEAAPLWHRPPKPFVPVLAALRELERSTRDAGGLVLRLGHLYGPGTIYAPNGSFVRQVRAGKLPLVGGGTATFSFSHTYDVAAAVVAALDGDETGVLNVVDDEPARMSEWLPFLATMIDAPRPKSVPAVLARFAVGPWGVAFMSELRGADNTRAKDTLDWELRYASWRTGFAAELGGTAAADASQ
ncbi:NAD(P)-dependent oxidoreductase [Actinomadura sp. 7K507]|uniref:NAD-dependent epimerase/dehydratase family protein n=1 Tax=Actinomadura sp. 7K507 TaxID=2530365 RepID=UPI001048D556|nr:NAD(P)-dependent oxidoreductase [Actinomadura sp. 7K507]TDC95676.1 NAD(P)-dependent oxidoreductase [Actinomadura sp. 7K507]